eukprot:UN00688
MISSFYVIFFNILVNGGELFDNTLQYLQLMYDLNEPFYIHTPCCSEGWLSTGTQANQNGVLFVEESSTSPPKAVLYVNDIDVNNSPDPTISFYWDNAGTRTYLCDSYNTAHWSISFGTTKWPHCVFRIRESGSVIPWPVLGSSIEMKGIKLFCGNSNYARNRYGATNDERFATCQGTGSIESEIYIVPVNNDIKYCPCSASSIIPNISPNISPNINTLYTLQLKWVMPIIGVVLILLLSMGMYLTYYSFTVRRNSYGFEEPQASK